jgi:hypothetical protein
MSSHKSSHKASHHGSHKTLTGAQLAAASESAMKDLSSFHVTGTENGSGTTAFSLNVSPDGGGGNVSVPGATVQIVVTAGLVYVKANEQSWLKLSASETTAQLAADHWVKVPESNSNFSYFADLTISSDFVQQSLATGPGVVKLPGTTTWDGTKATALVDPGGDKLYVEAKGAPYVLHVQAKGSDSYLTFSEFGDATVPAAPSNAIPLPNS